MGRLPHFLSCGAPPTRVELRYKYRYIRYDTYGIFDIPVSVASNLPHCVTSYIPTQVKIKVKKKKKKKS